ncbi:S-layer homology domain-containing protein [Paenibacillus pinistramenti]|uniref:S-layer homology domain-containing protein n=1 Tax=Paenibacillus pinistramenti TaxID=1768003 RepID=UPI00110A0055|nr:S-layer homology domain-containing protein [Paenibacillus pinistramenti]
MKKSVRTLLTALLLSTAALPAWAFSDTATDINAAKIEALESAHILNGQPDGKFNPQGSMTYAAGVSAIVSGFDLKLPAEKSTAADSAGQTNSGAWYSKAFAVAAANGLTLPSGISPNSAMTREAFVNLLSEAINSTGNYPTILLYTDIKDSEELTPAYANSVQHLLNIGIKLLDEKGSFLPQQTVTRSTAAGWLYDGIQYVKLMKGQESSGAAPGAQPPILSVPANDPLSGYALTVSKVSDKVNEVTISAQAPTPGYSLTITSIVFKGSQALIYTQSERPDSGSIVPQVITEIQTSTYISSEYEPVLANGGSESAGSLAK